MIRQLPKLTSDQVLELPASSWDERIAADLNAEMEHHLAEKIETVPEMRRFLAVKGFRELKQRIETYIEGKRGAGALRAMAVAMRVYALERPGMSAATFRTAMTDSPEWRLAHDELEASVLRVLAENGLAEDNARHALRILRCLVRGFVLNEMAASFLDSLDYERTYELALDVFLAGVASLNAEAFGAVGFERSEGGG